MSLSVWVFCDVPVGTVSGVSYMVESWQRELRALGHRTRVYTPSGRWGSRSRDSASVMFRTMRHVSHPGDYHSLFSSVAELRRARREVLPDVILITTPGRVGALGVTVAGRYRIPVVLVVSTDTIGAAQHYRLARAAAAMGPKPAVAMLAAPNARGAFHAQVQPVGGDGRRRLSGTIAARWANALHAEACEVVVLSAKSQQTYDAPERGLCVTLFPVGIDRLPESEAPPELRWRPGALRVLYVGRFAPEKSLGVLVRALGLAVRDGVDAHLVLVGEGPLRESLREDADRLGVGERVTVIGPYDRASLRGIYASADVFAFPSVVETQAFVLNEAAHEGLPLLVADDAVNPVVRRGESAVVVDHEPAAFAEGLRDLLDPGLRARLGATARALAGGFSEATQASKLADVLARAVETGRNRENRMPAGAREPSVTVGSARLASRPSPESDCPAAERPRHARPPRHPGADVTCG